MVRLTDRPAMTIAVDLGRKATKQTNKNMVMLHIKLKGMQLTITYYQIFYSYTYP